MAATTCAYCNRRAVDGGYIQPAMCERHFDVAIIVSWLAGRGQPVTLENVRVLVGHYRPRMHIQPDDVDVLLASMAEKEAVPDGEQ